MPAAGRAFSPVPARRNRSSISLTPRWPRILNGRKPPSASWRLASWRNGIRQPSLLPSSLSKARNGVKSFERPALCRSDGQKTRLDPTPSSASLRSDIRELDHLRPPLGLLSDELAEFRR